MWNTCITIQEILLQLKELGIWAGKWERCNICTYDFDGEVSLRTVIGGPERDGLSFRILVSEWQIFNKVFNRTKTLRFVKHQKYHLR
jgi:hypothetical protein